MLEMQITYYHLNKTITPLMMDKEWLFVPQPAISEDNPLQFSSEAQHVYCNNNQRSLITLQRENCK
jgi:hypothetical protein